MDQVETWLLIVIMVVAVPLVLLFIARRAARSRVDPTEVTIDPTLAATLVDMYHQGNKVQATKLLKERGYYPTGNVLVYNPHPASQPSEGAKEKPAGA